MMNWGQTVRRFLAGCVLLGLSQTAVGQGGVTGGAREIVSITFASGALPREIKSPSSGMLSVQKDGVWMLRASTEGEFRLQLPEQLPQNFTLEFDLIAKECGCDPHDLRFDGTAGSSQSGAYAEVQWSPMTHAVVGGGLSNNSTPFTATTPSLGETLTGQLAKIVVGFEGDVIKLYTNGTRLYTVASRQFARSKVLRVSLGGMNEEENAVYLARIRVAEGTVTATTVIAQNPGGRISPTAGRLAGQQSPTNAPPPTPPPAAPPPPPPLPPPPPPPAAPPPAPPASSTGVTGVVAQVDAQGNVSVSWQPVQGVTSYYVVRWLVGDPVCCGNMSPPEGMNRYEWQDGIPPKAGTYGYRVYANNSSVISTGETTLTYQPPPPPAPPPFTPGPKQATVDKINSRPPPRTLLAAGFTAAGSVSIVPIRTIAAAGFTAAGGSSLVPPRTIAAAGFTATGPVRSVLKGVLGTDPSALPASRTIIAAGFAASGGMSFVAPRTISVSGFTASGGVSVIPPRVIKAAGWTAAAP